MRVASLSGPNASTSGFCSGAAAHTASAKHGNKEISTSIWQVHGVLTYPMHGDMTVDQTSIWLLQRTQEKQDIATEKLAPVFHDDIAAYQMTAWWHCSISISNSIM